MLEVAGQRGQTVVTWDFEYVLFFLVVFVVEGSVSSSGDSEQVGVQESDRRYDEVVKNHPSTLLALNHEVYSTYPSSIFSLKNDTICSDTETTVYAFFAPRHL